MSPGTTQVLGTAATLYGLGGALSVLLQARRMHIRGTSGDVSARFFTVYVGGFAIWLLYGLCIGDVPIVLVHAVGLLCGTVTLAVVLRLRRPAGSRPGQPFSSEPEHRARRAKNRTPSGSRRPGAEGRWANEALIGVRDRRNRGPTREIGGSRDEKGHGFRRD